MAFTKNPAVVLAFMTLFGLDAMAAPQVGKTSVTDLLDYTLIPLSTVSETSLVLVLPTAAASTSTIVIEQSSVEVITTSRTVVVTKPIETKAPSSTSLAASTVTVTAASSPSPPGAYFSYVPIILPQPNTTVGATCLEKEKNKNDRQNDLIECTSRNNIKTWCQAAAWNCQEYYFNQARNCYARSWDDCKKDGYFTALGDAAKEAKSLRQKHNQGEYKRPTRPVKVNNN